ncbi:MAG: hypothetical protein ABW148_04760 [Sedimenticola sp.]
MTSNNWHKPQYGCFFNGERNKLYHFDKQHIQVIRGYPSPMAWKKDKNNPAFFPFRPTISFKQPSMKSASRSMLARWELVNTFPENIRKPASVFTDRHWHVAQVLTRCGNPAYDLHHNNPTLLYMLASCWVFHPITQPMRATRSLLKKRQIVIQEWLCLPPKRAVTRILRKISLPSITIINLLYLRSAITSVPDLVKTLGHLPRINSGVLRIVCDPKLRPFAGHSLLTEIGMDRDNDRWSKAGFVLNEITYMAEDQNVPLHRQDSLAEMADLHEALTYRINQNSLKRILSNRQFQQPPIPGNKMIHPITSEKGLRQHAAQQKNCVGTYTRQILKGDLYIYAINQPQPATLSLLRRGETWELDELKAKFNRSVKKITAQAVDRWFAEHKCPRKPVHNSHQMELPWK